MPWPSDGTASPNTYVQWWVKFLGPQTGAAGAPGDTPRLRYFKAAEPFSNIYDGSVVTCVISVRFWAQVRTSPAHAALLDYTKRYPRAQWAVLAPAAGTGPARWCVLDGRTPTTSQTQTPARDFRPSHPARCRVCRPPRLTNPRRPRRPTRHPSSPIPHCL